MWPFRKADDLLREAHECLEMDLYDEARKLGKKLKKMRHSGAFEILAMAEAGEERVDKAIAILEEGVAVAPSVWLLWSLLGNYRSDAGRFDDSHRAFRKALECPGVNPSSVHFNIGIAYSRQENGVKALAHYEQVTDPEMRVVRAVARVTVLCQLGRHHEALATGRTGMAERDAETHPGLLGAVAKAVWLAKQDRTEALALAWKAIGIDAGEHNALWTIRAVENRHSPIAKHFHLLVHGRWHEKFEDQDVVPEFYRTFEVVAESPEEALAFAAPFEPEPVRRSLRIEECDEIESRPGEPKGVYEVFGHIYFDADASRLEPGVVAEITIQALDPKTRRK